MNISNHIIALLQINEQVVVPGLGTFIVEYNSAKINSADNVLSPPSKKVIFDSFTPDDNILTEYVSKNEGITLEEANLQIKDYVENILTSIQKNNECEIIGLGKFIITKDNQIAFLAFEKNFSDEHFGLPEFAASEIKKNNCKEDEQKKFDKSQNSSNNSLKRKNIRKTIFISLLFLILSIVFFIFFFTDIFRGNYGENKDTTDNILQNEKISIKENKISSENISQNNVTKDTINKENQTNNKVNSSNDIQEVKPEKKIIEQKKTDKQVGYYLVAGSFKQEENAIKRVNELIAKGYKYAGVTRSNQKGLFIVYYGMYSNISEAEKQKDIIKKEENPETWILKN